MLGQAKISENITKKLMFNDKMIETQSAQIVVAIPANHSGKISGQPENSPEFVHVAAEQ